ADNAKRGKRRRRSGDERPPRLHPRGVGGSLDIRAAGGPDVAAAIQERELSVDRSGPGLVGQKARSTAERPRSTRLRPVLLHRPRDRLANGSRTGDVSRYGSGSIFAARPSPAAGAKDATLGDLAASPSGQSSNQMATARCSVLMTDPS